MTAPVLGLDHIVIGVNDLDKGAETYRRLGFTLSPRGVHSASMGSANHTIMLQRDYFELLAILAPTERNAQWRTAIAKGEGVIGAAIATNDAAATHDGWQQAGLHPRPVIDFARPVDRLDGSKMEASFQVVSLPEETSREVGFFACAHLTRDAVWLPELLDHPNTALGIQGLTLVAENPELAAATWQRVLAVSDAEAIEAGLRLTAGRHVIDVLAPGTANRFSKPLSLPNRPGIAAINFAAANIEQCRAALARGGFVVHEDSGRLIVQPGDACGVAIIMTAEAVNPGDRR